MLHELVAYAERNLPDSEPGFKTRTVRWAVELAADGRLLGVLPLGDGKRGEALSHCPDMHKMNAAGSAQRAQFLVEQVQYTVLLTKDDEEPSGKAVRRNKFYRKLVEEAEKKSKLLHNIVSTIRSEQAVTEIREALREHKAKPGDWMTWRIAGTYPHLDDAVSAWWRDWRGKDLNPPDEINIREMVCLLTGENVEPLATHPKIGGLIEPGKQLQEALVVACDKHSFTSYDLKKSANAAMNGHVAQAYANALNDLIGRAHKLAGVSTVYWFKEQVEPAENPLAWLLEMETPETTEAVACSAAKKLLHAIRLGRRPDLGNNRYYALALSRTGARVMVRDWMEGQFETLVHNIGAWFDHLSIVTIGGKKLAAEPRFFQVALALVRNDRRKSVFENLKQLPSPAISDLWHAAAQGQAIPRKLMINALARFRAERFTPDDRGREQFNQVQLGLIKAYFIRLKPGGDPTMTPYLNPDHPAAAYHCGRLLAVLSSLQRAALGDVGAGVVQRYYAAASTTPGLILGRLASNARNHLGKLEAGRAWWYEGQIAAVMARLGDGAPRILDLEGQGLFALGYYQQLAALRAGNKTETDGNDQDSDQGAEQ